MTFSALIGEKKAETASLIFAYKGKNKRKCQTGTTGAVM